MKSNLELKRVSRRPADALRGRVGEENMGNEAEDESDDAHVEHEGVAQQQANDAGASLRDFAQRQMN